MSFSKTVHFSKVTVLSNIYFSEHWSDSFQLSIIVMEENMQHFQDILLTVFSMY